MSDIVERLRKGIEWTGPTQDDTGQTENLMDEAADEIERLREWNREIALNAREFVAENERLRAALLWFTEEYERTYFIRTADMHEQDCRCMRCARDNARAALGDTHE